MYSGILQKERIFLLRQVDDFAVSAPTSELATLLLKNIQKHLTQPLKLLGILSMYNGLDIAQTDKYIKLTCKTYLSKILQGHGWHHPTTQSKIRNPMNHDKNYIKTIETSIGSDNVHEQKSLQLQMGFSYRRTISELMFAAVTCRPDILHTVIKLSQYSNRPVSVHYIAVKRVYRYLRDTINDGLHFWREHINTSLPTAPVPVLPPDNYTLKDIASQKYTQPYGTVDADWAGDVKHRKSISGIGLFFAGSPVLYRSRYQPTVSLSSTESEFIAAAEAGKMALYIQSLLNEIGIEQTDATKLYEDNAGAISMANVQRPTRRTPHLDIRHFALLDWVETDQLVLETISTHDNPADALTKILGPQLFSRHSFTLLGKRKPMYCTF